ncbi:MAG: ArnT family glycosyltransferase [Tabrizicola sp.]
MTTLSAPHPATGTRAAWPWLALALFALLAFLPAQSALPVTDRDEARFVQASRQMVESGDFVDIRFQDVPRHKKPVGIYWLQSAAAVAVGGGPEAPLWVYRLPSLAGAVLSVLLVAVAGAPLFGRKPALLAAALFAGTLVIGGEARIAKTDAALLATTLGAQAVLARLYLRQKVGGAAVWGFWLAIAAGLLIKGPIGPMVPGLTALALVALDRRAGWLRPLAAPLPIGAALVLVLPWFVAITLRTEGAFWTGSVGADLLPKIAAGQEGKGAPPGTYLLALPFTFWPALPLLILALPAIWRARREAATRFCLAWAIPVWLVYEAVPTKLIHYTLPALPALALLAVGHLPATASAVPRLLRGLAVLAFLPGLALGGLVLSYGANAGDRAAAVLMLAGLAGAVLAGGLAIRFWRRSEPRGLVVALAMAGVVLHGALISAVARIPGLWPTEAAVALAGEVAAAQGCDRPRLTGWGYQEPSLVWRGGRDTRLVAASTPADLAVRPGACEVVIHLRDGALDLDALAMGCQLSGTVTGLAIGAGKRVTLDVLDCGGRQ